MKFLKKYGILILLFIFLVYKTQRYYDFVASIQTVINSGIIIIILIIYFIVIYIIESKKKQSHKTTNFFLLTFLFLFVLNIMMNYFQFNKKIINEYYVSPNVDLKTGGYEIKFYEDKSYEINEYWHGKSEHYFGKYEFNNDTLNLKNNNVEEKTQSQITTKYKLNRLTNELQSLNIGFPNLKPREY